MCGCHHHFGSIWEAKYSPKPICCVYNSEDVWFHFPASPTLKVTLLALLKLWRVTYEAPPLPLHSSSARLPKHTNRLIRKTRVQTVPNSWAQDMSWNSSEAMTRVLMTECTCARARLCKGTALGVLSPEPWPWCRSEAQPPLGRVTQALAGAESILIQAPHLFIFARGMHPPSQHCKH